MASKSETIMAALVTTLQGIAAGANGATYTPGRVARVSEFTGTLAPRDSSIPGAPLYYLRRGEETRKLGPDTCDMTCDLEVFLLQAIRNTEPTLNPSSGRSGEVDRIQGELASDACAALFLDPTVGVQNARLLEDMIRIDYDDQWVAGWISVELRFVVRYRLNRPSQGSDFR